MKNQFGKIALAVLIVVVLLGSTVAYTVDSTEMALVKTFGKAGEPINGATEAGLRLKWPWPFQKLVKYDGRTFIFESITRQFGTRDNKQMIVTMYCAWRIHDVLKFQKTVTTVENAENRLRDLLNSAEKVLGSHEISEYVNTNPERMRLAQIEGELSKFVAEEAEPKYGVDIVMVGIKSLTLPENVTAEVIEAMKKERQKFINRYRGSGNAQAQAIEERAKSAREKILAFAKRRADQIRAEGDRAAAEEFAKFAKNEELAMYIRWLESLKTELKGKAVILLDSSTLSPLQNFMAKPMLPSAPDPDGKTTAADRPATETDDSDTPGPDQP
ncbi:MAG: SPFH domain-containing protein [Phycisphaerae bacterium]